MFQFESSVIPFNVYIFYENLLHSWEDKGSEFLIVAVQEAQDLIIRKEEQPAELDFLALQQVRNLIFHVCHFFDELWQKRIGL